MRYFPGFVAIITLFFFTVYWALTGTIDTMAMSEQARIADMGDSMAEALENAAINVLEKHVDADYKTRGVVLISTKDENGIGYASIDDIKLVLDTEIREQFEEYASNFNRNVNIGGGEVRPVFDYEILINPATDIGLGRANPITEDSGFGQRYANQRDSSGDARDRNSISEGDYPFYKATLNIKFYSGIKSLNAHRDASGAITRGPVYDLNYPIAVSLKHVNTESDNYRID